jgi:hypothetical protein
LLKRLRPFVELVVFLLGLAGVFVTWWVLLILGGSADNLGEIWYYFARSIYLGIPIFVLLNILRSNDKKERIIWIATFMGAPVFVTLINIFWWSFSKVSEVKVQIWGWLQDLIALI